MVWRTTTWLQPVLRVALGSAIIGVAFASTATTARAQEMSSVEHRASQVLGLMFHGPTALPASFRDSVLAETELIEYIAALVRGERELATEWHLTTALWWLAEAGEAKYGDIFAAHAGPDSPKTGYKGLVRLYAAYGLARTSSSPASRAALHSILAGQDDRLITHTIKSLSIAGDTSALRLLAEADTSRVPMQARFLIRDISQRPPAAVTGRYCLEGEDSDRGIGQGCTPR